MKGAGATRAIAQLSNWPTGLLKLAHMGPPADLEPRLSRARIGASGGCCVSNRKRHGMSPGASLRIGPFVRQFDGLAAPA